MLIDTHAHLMEPQFDSDRKEVIQRALDAGVQKMLNVGCTIVSCEKSDSMSLEYDFLYGTQGLHPSDYSDFSEKLMKKFYEIVKHNKKIVAIGETGLDYHYENADPVRQQESLRAQMKLAEELNLPVIIHCRDAEKDMLLILKEFPEVRCILHCFAQDRAYADVILEMEKGWNPDKNFEGHRFLFSFSGILTYPKAQNVRDVAIMLSDDQMCVETDCPYLPPQSKRGQRNEPAYIVETVRKLAEIRGVSFEKISEFTTMNAERFFRI